MVALDDRFYPHIVDQIWSYMNYPDYLIGRRVSRSWKRRADHRLRTEENLARHISISVSRVGGSNGKAVTNGLPEYVGKGKGKAKEVEVEIVADDSGDGVDMIEVRSRDVFAPHRSVILCYEPLSFWSFAGNPELERHWSLLFAKTELVDLMDVMSFRDGKDYGRLPSMIGPFATLRWHHGGRGVGPLLTDHSTQVVFGAVDAARGLTVPRLRISTAGLAEVVINVDCFTNPLKDTACLDSLNSVLALPDFIKEWSMITMILNNKIPDWDKAKDSRPGYTSVGLMINFIETARELELTVRVVGVERFLDDPDLWDTLLFRVREQMEDPEERNDLVVFWTHEDYKMQYGIEQYLTHTVR
ncbi:hypothetical protein A1Q1_01136 [Trichosporon asahii var. asahii CBS 2479]|uniref:Uncharacterized protein n=1 Tax=Trichosporon asahii var. asahii (strain ATCC 90039 / CBS 2479 / JCM 2466 / KCTC 7840 / NBRC 103889/ NCYC 2677 / UAMH 7654) TaxID=1186058 RepID=J6EYH6_TRIAS|nr:hypothetical protein A1Q1_01136 [Trichosporon asahii var. asahii CBS 2479]EJT49714.1 hypothetical protein A1Q1_01136 [Trichosporon asahii var. asahii CBS 2479]